jgi:hypothetical protein
MKRFLAAFAAILLGSSGAFAQTQSLVIVQSTNADGSFTLCAVGTANCNVPTTGGSGAGGNSAVTITSTLPTIATATAVPTASKAGAAYVQPVFDSTTGGGSYVGLGTGLPVNITQVNGASTSGGIPVTATSLAVISGSTDGTSKTGLQYSGVAAVAETSASALTNGTQGYMSLDPNNRSLRIDNVASTAGGLSISSQYVPANNTALAIDASPGQLYGIEMVNNNATILYVNYYDAAQGSVSCAATATAKYHTMIPANSTSGAGIIREDVFGLPFTTAITQCVGTVYGGTGLPTADEYIINVFYK